MSLRRMIKICEQCDIKYRPWHPNQKFCSWDCYCAYVHEHKLPGTVSSRYYQKNKDKYAAYQREYNKKNPQHGLKTRLRDKYGLTLEEYYQLMADQNMGCAICRRPFVLCKQRPDVDHDHKTGKVRGLLCHGCNILIGRLESPLKDKALEYLKSETSNILRHRN